MIAWLYWDPPKDLFNLPFLERPIAIYGVCFVLGFFISYFILARMLSKKLSLADKIYDRDIASWPALIKTLQISLDKPENPLFRIGDKLDPRLKADIMTLQLRQEPTNEQKRLILDAINRCRYTRPNLENCLHKALYTAKDQGYFLTDKATWFIVLGTLIGARLGTVLFYDLPYYMENPASIIKVWEGGLASHGGVVGILIALALYSRFVLREYPEISFTGFLDLLIIPSSLAGAFIRIGNFFNQEILGPPTTLPWGIIFGNPVDRGPIVPRHPTQLYEAAAYLLIFLFLMRVWRKRHASLPEGYTLGLGFILIFGARFLIEFIKQPQSMMMDESLVQTGQLLSIPFILWGFYLYYSSKKSRARILGTKGP